MVNAVPSRACILTGRNSWQLGAACNHWCYFPSDIRVFTEVLLDSGYFVGYTGKGWAPGIALTADGKERKLTGTPFARPAHQAAHAIDQGQRLRGQLRGFS